MASPSTTVLGADYVVVGAGSAGCVLADRLTEDGRSSVVLLEAGGSTSSVAVRVPALIQKQPSRLNWLYPTEPDPSRDGVADPYSAGRGLGGSSAVNAMMWVRGHPSDYDGWGAAGATGWDYAAVLPHFRAGERFEDGADAYRGGAGPVSVARTRVANPMTARFIAAAGEAGFPTLADYNGAEPLGASYAQVNQRRGLRHTAADAHLGRARGRAGLSVVTGAAVTRVVVSGGRARAVEYVDGAGRRHHVHADREVILAAGAIGSPRLLLLSGIGSADAVRRLGIDPVVDLAGVGQGLQDHPGTSLRFEVTERTINQEVTPVHLVRHGMDFLLRGRGAFTTTANQAVVFGRLDGSGPAPDAELVFMAYGLDPADSEAPVDDGDHGRRASRLARLTARSGGREGGRRQVSTAPLVTVTAVLLHPHGRGSVVLRSADPADPPVVRQQLLSDPRDVAGLTRAARAVREVFAAPAIRSQVLGERGTASVVTDDAWAAHLRRSTFSLFHASGTCRMGPDGVVDPSLRVHGVDGLRVADASVMPTITSGNTQAPTMMIGSRASELVLGDRG